MEESVRPLNFSVRTMRNNDEGKVPKKQGAAEEQRPSARGRSRGTSFEKAKQARAKQAVKCRSMPRTILPKRKPLKELHVDGRFVAEDVSSASTSRPRSVAQDRNTFRHFWESWVRVWWLTAAPCHERWVAWKDRRPLDTLRARSSS